MSKEMKKDKLDKKPKADKDAKVKKIDKNKNNDTSKDIQNNKGKKERKTISKQTYLLIALIISLIAFLLLFLNLTLKGDNLFSFDFTHSHIYRLSKQSKEIIKSIDEPIEISIDRRLSYPQITEVLDQIVNLNRNITVSIIEEDDDEENTYYATIFVNASDREELAFSFFDLNFDASLIEYETFKQYTLFEEKLINSMIAVTKGETKETSSVAFVAGLDGAEISEELINLYTELRAFGILPIELDINKEDIPESITTIAIIGPMKDINKNAYNRLIEFQARGGNFVIGATFLEDKSLPRFEKFLSTYGVSLPVGSVFEYNDEYRHSVIQSNGVKRNYNNILLPIVTKNNEITEDMVFEATSPFFIFPTIIKFESQEKLQEKNITYNNHVLTSDMAVFKKDEVTDLDITDEELPEDALPNVYVLGTIVDKKLSNEVSSTAVIYSNYLFVSDLIIKDLIEDEIILQRDNLRLAKNSFIYLSSLKDEMISVKKALVVSPYKYNKDKVVLHKVFTYVFYGIPILSIIFLSVMMLYRRGYLSKYGITYKKEEDK